MRLENKVPERENTGRTLQRETAHFTVMRELCFSFQSFKEVPGEICKYGCLNRERIALDGIIFSLLFNSVSRSRLFPLGLEWYASLLCLSIFETKCANQSAKRRSTAQMLIATLLQLAFCCVTHSQVIILGEIQAKLLSCLCKTTSVFGLVQETMRNKAGLLQCTLVLPIGS